MANKLYQYLAKDHERLDKLLEKAIGEDFQVDYETYEEFRKGLLRHISIEEKIVFPFMYEHDVKKTDPFIEQLRLDHSAIVLLLVAEPSPSTIATLLSVLEIHNELEERVEGLYEMLEEMAGEDSSPLYEQFLASPDVPVLPTKPRSKVMGFLQRALERAGHPFIEKDE